MSNDDRMSSVSGVSRSSRISAKSMVIIEAQDKLLVEQGGQISDMAREMAMMKKLLEEAGIKPPVESMDLDLDQARLAKRRQLSGSPSGKHWDELDELDSSSTSDDISEEDRQLSYPRRMEVRTRTRSPKSPREQGSVLEICMQAWRRRNR